MPFLGASFACHCWPPIALHCNQLECPLNWVRISPGYKESFDDEEVLVKRDLLSGVEEYNDSLPIKDNAINDEYFRQFLDGG